MLQQILSSDLRTFPLELVTLSAAVDHHGAQGRETHISFYTSNRYQAFGSSSAPGIYITLYLSCDSEGTSLLH